MLHVSVEDARARRLKNPNAGSTKTQCPPSRRHVHHQSHTAMKCQVPTPARLDGVLRRTPPCGPQAPQRIGLSHLVRAPRTSYRCNTGVSPSNPRTPPCRHQRFRASLTPHTVSSRFTPHPTLLTTGTTSLPLGTASDPPGRKSFCRSITTRAVPLPPPPPPVATAWPLAAATVAPADPSPPLLLVMLGSRPRCRSDAASSYSSLHGSGPLQPAALS